MLQREDWPVVGQFVRVNLFHPNEHTATVTETYYYTATPHFAAAGDYYTVEGWRETWDFSAPIECMSYRRYRSSND